MAINIRLTVTHLLRDDFWGFSDLLKDLGPGATEEEKHAAILELIHEDNWAALDP